MLLFRSAECGIDTLDRAMVMGKRDYAILRLLWDNGCRGDRSDFEADGAEGSSDDEGFISP